jgi:hypothetical protein
MRTARSTRALGIALAIALLGALLAAPTPATAGGKPRVAEDAVVVAVLDSAINPYHWDFQASKMPQALDKNRGNDLPLTTPPDRWLPGFPSPKAFDSYQSLELSYERKDANAPIAPLLAKDEAKIADVKPSSAEELNYYWLPGTKVIGAMRFGTQPLVGATR